MLASIITVGDEILIGQIVDTNSAWLGTQLNLQGIQVQEIRTVPDDEHAIRQALTEVLKHSNLVLMTGGLGPTKDDVTKKALADFFSQELAFHEETYGRMVKLFKRFGREPTQAHYHQAYHPEGATLLTNPKGTAPAMWFEQNDQIVVAMPGIPYEMKAIMQQEVFSRLKAYDRHPIAYRTILTAGLGESEIAELLQSFEEHLPDHIGLSYLPNLGQVRLRLTSKSVDPSKMETELHYYADQIKGILLHSVFGEEEQTLEEVVGQILLKQKKRLATAESCTGGYIASRVVSIPGASRYMESGVIVYTNRMKAKLLGVSEQTLEKHGAVSEETVIEMAKGALERLEADVVLAVSGIMGPSGGTADKPVGTVWMAVADREKVKTTKLSLSKDRALNIEYTGNAGLNQIRKFLLDLD